jgi:hypothetical protein
MAKAFPLVESVFTTAAMARTLFLERPLQARADVRHFTVLPFPPFDAFAFVSAETGLDTRALVVAEVSLCVFWTVIAGAVFVAPALIAMAEGCEVEVLCTNAVFRPTADLSVCRDDASTSE